MKNLPTPYQDFIHKSRYARWNEEEKRREDWDETVDRYLDYVIFLLIILERLMSACTFSCVVQVLDSR
jgi:hypothetical protein